MTALAENLERLERQIAAACVRAGRQRSEIELMAVSKTYSAATLAEAASLGLTLFGESRVQEFAAKAAQLSQSHRLAPDVIAYLQTCQGTTSVVPQTQQLAPEGGGGFNPRTTPAKSARALAPADNLARAVGQGFIPGINLAKSARALAPEVRSSGDSPTAFPSFAANTSPIRVHLIGHLQTNKAARAAELFDAVDSVDSLRLAQRLNEVAGKLGKRLPILIEVKLSPEETKAGLDPESSEAEQLLERLPDLHHLQTRGLMTIAPWGVAEEVTRACFSSLREWRDRWAPAHPKLAFDVLSMGMSGDFALAIEEGATRIRIGTALFGKRQPWTGAE